MKNCKTSTLLMLVAFFGYQSTVYSGGLADVGSALETVQKTKSTVDSINTTVETAKTVSEVSQNGLVETLVKQLGVTTTQAEGGSGALFQAAKSQMTGDEFSQLSEGVPGMDGMLAAAPKAESSSTSGSLLSSVAKMSGNSSVQTGANLVNAFQKLDMSKGMVSQFTPVVVDYVKKNSGEVSGNLLKSALSLF